MQVPNAIKKHVFIGGSIGVGKSSILDQLYGMLETDCVIFISEYIDHDVCGEMMLGNHLKGKISMLFFQRYILENFRSQIETEKYRKASIVLWERHPMECYFFIEQSIKDQKCSQGDYDVFRREMMDFCLAHDIPDLERGSFKAFACDTFAVDVPIVAEIIKHQMLDTFTYYWGENVYCFLYCSVAQEQIKRIQKRGRKCEIERYTSAEQMLEFNKAYLKFIESKISGLKSWENKRKLILN